MSEIQIEPPNIDVVCIGDRIESLRVATGLSQSALARLVRTSQSAVAMIEAGFRNPSYALLVRISKALGVTMPHLVDVEFVTDDMRADGIRMSYAGLNETGRQLLAEYATFLHQIDRMVPVSVALARQ